MAEGEEMRAHPARDESRRLRFAPALALVSALLLGNTARAEDKVTVTWHGKPYSPTTLPADLGEAPRAAVAEWEPWARKSGYRMDFDATGRILLLTFEKTSRADTAMATVARAETWFDELLPSTNPAPSAASASTPSGAKASKGAKPAPAKPKEEIPEDPESAPPVLAPPKGSPGSKTGTPKPEVPASSWGSGSFAPDSRTGVVIAFWNEKDQESALAQLAQKHADLAEWCAKAGKDLGFVVENP